MKIWLCSLHQCKSPGLKFDVNKSLSRTHNLIEKHYDPLVIVEIEKSLELFLILQQLRMSNYKNNINHS